MQSLNILMKRKKSYQLWKPNIQSSEITQKSCLNVCTHVCVCVCVYVCVHEREADGAERERDSTLLKNLLGKFDRHYEYL